MKLNVLVACAANLGPANGLSTCVPVLGGPTWACNASKTLSADDQKTCVSKYVVACVSILIAIDL